jgi:hypothetical protein
VLAIQGNYDESLALGKGDCGCGYADPRDNFFARVSYEYTFQKTSLDNKAWLGRLPKQRRIRLGPLQILMCHGSPRTINEFLWDSTLAIRLPTGGHGSRDRAPLEEIA